jgi:hypothetical protein
MSNIVSSDNALVSVAQALESASGLGSIQMGAVGPLQTSPGPQSWSEVSKAVASAIGAQPLSSVASVTGGINSGVKEMSTLLRLQSQLQSYQLRIELASKVAESATTSVRKLQQQQ